MSEVNNKIETTLQTKVNRVDFHKYYIKMLNGLLDLTNREIEILGLFCNYKNELEYSNISEKDKLTLLFGSVFRDQICEKLDMNYNNLNNFIASMKKKGKLVYTGNMNEKLLDIHPRIYRALPKNVTTFKHSFEFLIMDEEITS